MRPTVAQARAWDPSVLRTRGDAARAAGARVGTLAEGLLHGREGLECGWTGRAADAAVTHADTEWRCATAAAEDLRLLGDALATAADVVDGALQSVLRAIGAAEAEGLDVDDSGVHTRPGASDPDGSLAAAAERHAAAIGAALDTLGAVDDEQAAAVRREIESLRAGVPAGIALDAAEGAAVADLTTDGFVTDLDLARLHGDLLAAGLTPETLRRIANGEVVDDLPPGAMDFLQGFYSRTGVEGLLLVTAALDRRGGADAATVSAQLGDGVLALSNESVGDVDGGRGGYSRLPEPVRQLVENRRMETPAGMTPYASAAFGQPGTPARSLLADRFWRAAGRGTVPPGRELSARLLSATSTQVRRFGGPTGTYNQSQYDTAAGSPRGTSGAWRSSGQAQMELVGRRPDTVADVLAGDPAERRRILDPLVTHDWADGGAALGRPLARLDSDLAAPEGSPEWRRGAAASFGLAQYLSEDGTSARLRDVDGPNTVDVGEVNPELTRAMAHGLGRTVGMLAQDAPVPAGMPGWSEGLDRGGHYDHAARVTELLSGDPIAAHELSAAAGRRQHELLAAGGLDEMAAVGRLSGLVDAGTAAVADERSDDAGESAQEAYERRKKLYDMGSDLLTDGPLSKVPGGGLAADVAGPMLLEDMIVGEDPRFHPDLTGPSVTGQGMRESGLRALGGTYLPPGTVPPAEADRPGWRTDELATGLRDRLEYAVPGDDGAQAVGEALTEYQDGYLTVRPIEVER